MAIAPRLRIHTVTAVGWPPGRKSRISVDIAMSEVGLSRHRWRQMATTARRDALKISLTRIRAVETRRRPPMDRPIASAMATSVGAMIRWKGA
jgi:hypothetical protein